MRLVEFDGWPIVRYCAAVACVRLLVWASLNCLHMAALASGAGGAIIQPTRRPGDRILLMLPQCASQSRSFVANAGRYVSIHALSATNDA